MENKGGGGIAGQPQHDDAVVGFGRIVQYVRKAEVTRQETGLVILGVTRDDRVFCVPQADVSNVYGFVAEFLQQDLGGTREVGVDQKAHGGNQPIGSGWWVSCSTSSSAYLMAARMSSALTSYSRHISSKVIPPANPPRMRATGTRVPRITGLPCWSSGSMMIRSFMVCLVVMGENRLFSFIQHNRGRLKAGALRLLVSPLTPPLRGETGTDFFSPQESFRSSPRRSLILQKYSPAPCRADGGASRAQAVFSSTTR